MPAPSVKIKGLEALEEKTEAPALPTEAKIGALTVKGLDQLPTQPPPSPTPQQPAGAPNSLPAQPAPASTAPPRQDITTRILDADGVPLVPMPQDIEAMRQKHAADELQRMMNPSKARTVGEFFEFSKIRIGRDLTNLAKTIWGGLERSAKGTYQTLDNMAQHISDVTGTDKVLLFEKAASQIHPIDPPETIPGQLIAALGATPIEVPKFALLSRGGPILSTIMMAIWGAEERYGEGPKAMMEGATAMIVLNTMFRATAVLPQADKAVIWPTTFMAVDAAEGRTSDEIAVSGATGLILSALARGGNPDLSLANQVRSSLRNSPVVQTILNRRAAELRSGEKLDEIAKEIADRYSEAELKGIRDTLDTVETGKVAVEGFPKGYIEQRAKKTPQTEGIVEIAAKEVGDPVDVRVGESKSLRGVITKKTPTEDAINPFSYEVKLLDGTSLKAARHDDVQPIPELIKLRREIDAGQQPKASPNLTDLLRGVMQGEAPVETLDIKGVFQVGSRASKKEKPTSDSDILYDLGEVKLPADPVQAAREVQTIIERNHGINLDAHDSFFKAGNRYFHVTKGAGREVVENTEYGRQQEGKPLVERPDLMTDIQLHSYLKQFDQQGFMSPEGRTRLVSEFRKGLEKAQKKIDTDRKAVEQVSQESVDAAWDKVQSTHHRMSKDLVLAEEPVKQRLIRWARNRVTDVSGTVKAELLKQGGLAGLRAKMHHDLIAGSMAKSQEAFYRFQQTVLHDMTSRQDLADLSAHVHGRRVIAIDSYRAGDKQVKHPGNLTGQDYKLSMIKNRQVWGEERYRKIDAAADRYFAWQREQVRLLYDAGLISSTEFKNLTKREYSPRIFINRIDPQLSYKLGGELINVPSSGIRPLERGSYSTLLTDVNLLAEQVIVRVTNRVMRNAANKALHDFASLVPDNTIVRLPKKVSHDKKGRAGTIIPPKGWVRVDAMIEGKQSPMFLNAAIAEEWIRSSPSMTRATANMLRLVSGSIVVRPLATGYNPLFALTNFPIDSALIWLRTNEYSPVLPLAMAQHWRDLLAVRKDAWRREGRYTDYINEGGGMSFLTHQGLSPLAEGVTRPTIDAQLNPRLARVKDALGHLNEFSELWNRLAIRERAIRNGASPTEATYIARNYLDFSQGGVYTKALDNVIPYLNAGVQGARSFVLGAKENPTAFSAKVAQFLALETALELANWTVNPEAMEQIPYDAKVQNWIITTPWYIIDSEGNQRWLYIPIRKEHALIGFTGVATTILEKGIADRVPTNAATTVLSSALPGPLKGGTGIPTVDFFYTYQANKNFWSDRNIWTGPKVPAEQEIYRFGSGKRPTNPIYIMAAQSLGMSPARLEGSMGKLVPNNLYTNLVGAAFREFVEGTTPYDVSRTTEENILTLPGMSRIVALTHPFSREADLADAIARGTEGELFTERATIDEMYALFRSNQLEGGVNTIRARIRNSPPERQESLHQHLESKIEVDRVFDRARVNQAGLPSRTWWSLLHSRSAEVRADVFYEEWRRRDAPERAQMERLGQRIQGFWTERFHLRFKKNLDQRGRDE